MIHTTYEPPSLEIWLTKALGYSVLSPYYHSFAGTLDLSGTERVLDFGSGSGALSRHLASALEESGGHLDCVEISPGWMEAIRRSLSGFDNVSFHLGWIKDLGLPDQAYDAVVVHHVFHEISEVELEEVVQVLVKKLRPGGRLLVREPGGQGLSIGKLTKLIRHAGAYLQHANTSEQALIGEYFDAHFQVPPGNENLI